MGMQSSMPNNLKVINSKHSVNSKDGGGAIENSNRIIQANSASKSCKVEKKAKSQLGQEKHMLHST